MTGSIEGRDSKGDLAAKTLATCKPPGFKSVAANTSSPHQAGASRFAVSQSPQTNVHSITPQTQKVLGKAHHARQRCHFMKRTYTAARTQLPATHGLSLSPILAAFHGRPMAPCLKPSKNDVFVWLLIVAARTKADVQISNRRTIRSAGKSKMADILTMSRPRRGAFKSVRGRVRTGMRSNTGITVYPLRPLPRGGLASLFTCCRRKRIGYQLDSVDTRYYNTRWSDVVRSDLD